MKSFLSILVVFLLCLIVIPSVFHSYTPVDFTELTVNHPDEDYLDFSPVSESDLLTLDSELNQGNLSLSEKFNYINTLVSTVRPFPSFPSFPSVPQLPALFKLGSIPTYIFMVVLWIGQVIRWFLLDLGVVLQLCTYIFIS